MKKLLIIAAAVVAAMGSGCTDQRDLYVKAGPMIYVEGDWEPSLGKTDMTMWATAVAYTSAGMYTKEYFYNPDNTDLHVDKGMYDVMIFNGMMYTDTDTHLDYVYFRGTDVLDTFEAVVAEGTPNRRLNRAEDEYIASNEMDIVTSAVATQQITGDQAYYLKYHNGKNGFITPDDYVEAELDMTPQAVSYNAKVTITITNITSAYSASGAFYGFVGSAFLASRMPSHFYVTHQFYLNHKQYIDQANDIGTIEAGFVTFGPPVDAPANTYSVYVKMTLIDGEVEEGMFDVTNQVEPIIEEIKSNMSSGAPVQYMLEIPINLTIDLPVVSNTIGVDGWEDDEIIKVPIKKP